jgi:hypothetical protein
MRIKIFTIFSKLSSRFIYLASNKFYTTKIQSIFNAIEVIEVEADKTESIDEVLAALVCGEDHRFYFHGGVDIYALARAIKRTAFGNIEGASTIEQQLVRTITSNYRISVFRKFTEICLAVAISQNYSKRQIAIAYLHSAYFGEDVIGLNQGMRLIKLPNEYKNICPLCYLIAHLKYPKPKLGIDKFHSKRINRAIRINRIKSHLSEGWMA